MQTINGELKLNILHDEQEFELKKTELKYQNRREDQNHEERMAKMNSEQ